MLREKRVSRMFKRRFREPRAAIDYREQEVPRNKAAFEDDFAGTKVKRISNTFVQRCGHEFAIEKRFGQRSVGPN
jgi:hypothetical protein